MTHGTGARPILLLGAAGQVGSELRPRLAALGPVVAVTRADADLEQPDALVQLVRRVAPAAVVNAAAFTAVDDAERDAARCRRINADAPAVLARETARLGAPIVHFSTNYVFDGAAARPYVEEDPVAPLGVYGATKAEGEAAVTAANPAHLIVRTAAVYAPTGRNFVRRILELARERDELQVVDDQVVALTPASALAEATVVMLGQLLGDRHDERFGVYHLTSAGGASWFEVAQRVLALDPAREEQRTTRVRPVGSAAFPTPARRPRNGLLNTDKVRRAFGIALPSWDASLQRALAPHSLAT
jgi:dTDP-4-dehydrorhamnose reductase